VPAGRRFDVRVLLEPDYDGDGFATARSDLGPPLRVVDDTRELRLRGGSATASPSRQADARDFSRATASREERPACARERHCSQAFTTAVAAELMQFESLAAQVP
jgi:hypothetical protein